MTIPVLKGRESWTRMGIAISGSSGLIGSELVRLFVGRGSDVRRLVRRAPTSPSEIAWDPDKGTIDAAKLEGVDVVVHLAGESLARRWSDDVKRRVRESRVKGTTLLARTLASMSRKPRVLMSGSAIGIYGSRGDEKLDESSTAGSDFLAEVCQEWESATAAAAEAGIRVIALRTGIVLARDGGAFPKLLLPFRLGLGGRLGDGRQWMSWIGLDDYVDALSVMMTNDRISGPVNLVAPNPVTNAEFTRTLARVLRRPAMLTVPKFAVKLALGEMGEETVLASQRVRPRRLMEAGFDFHQPTLESTLRHALTR